MCLTRWAVMFMLCLSVEATAQTTGRQRLSMDPEWRFTLGDPPGAERPAFDDLKRRPALRETPPHQIESWLLWRQPPGVAAVCRSDGITIHFGNSFLSFR